MSYSASCALSVLNDYQHSPGTDFSEGGLGLPKPVFAHGQLYVALSRTTTEDVVRVKLEETKEQGFCNGIAFAKNVINLEIIPPS